MNNNLNASSLLIIFWNANGIIQHRNELEFILLDKRIDVAMVSETHLTSRHYFGIQNYSIYRSDHPDDLPQGGTAVLVRNSLPHHPLQLNSTKEIQFTGISVHCAPFSFTAAAIYCPPRFAISSQMFSQAFTSLGTKFLAGGDFNAKHVQWGSRINNPKGRNLLKCIQDNNFSFISPPNFTYWPTAPTKQPDLLDFFVTKGLSGLYSHIDIIDELASDHSCLLLTLSVCPLSRHFPPSLTGNPVDWELFRQNLEAAIDLQIPLKTSDDLEEAVEHFVSSIHKAVGLSSRPKSFKPLPPNLPIYPLCIRSLVRQKTCPEEVANLPASR